MGLSFFSITEFLVHIERENSYPRLHGQSLVKSDDFGGASPPLAGKLFSDADNVPCSRKHSLLCPEHEMFFGHKTVRLRAAVGLAAVTICRLSSRYAPGLTTKAKVMAFVNSCIVVYCSSFGRVGDANGHLPAKGYGKPLPGCFFACVRRCTCGWLPGRMRAGKSALARRKTVRSERRNTGACVFA